MLQNSSRFVAFAVALFALVAFTGDPRSGTTSATQMTAVTPASTESVVIAAVGSLDRSSAASRALIRAEVAASATAAATEPPAVADSVPTTASAPDPEPLPVAAPAVAVAPVRVAPVAAPAVPATCAVNQFCYPRVGIAGPIVPYNDCSGSTDVGTAIRSLTCVSPTFLAAHAYTQFGRIAGWRAGDVVFAYGTRYLVVDAYTQQGCVPPARALAPLSLQTSLTSANCGPILVVQARPG